MKKTYIHICLAAFVATGAMTLSSCSQDDLLAKADEENAALTTTNENDTFTATFIPAMYEPMSRAAVDGTSSAVQSLKYLIYRTTATDSTCTTMKRNCSDSERT